ncbi:MAG: hypothetical protein ACLUKN_11975 [Bacilli bacterium]
MREIEAMAVGLRETLDDTVISQSPSFIEYLVNALESHGIPVVTPLRAWMPCRCNGFLPHVPQANSQAGALTAAFYLISGFAEWSAELFPV